MFYSLTYNRGYDDGLACAGECDNPYWSDEERAEYHEGYKNGLSDREFNGGSNVEDD